MTPAFVYPEVGSPDVMSDVYGRKVFLVRASEWSYETCDPIETSDNLNNDLDIALPLIDISEYHLTCSYVTRLLFTLSTTYLRFYGSEESTRLRTYALLLPARF
jgi:hypothetical protein